jgi:hypothetical protein
MHSRATIAGFMASGLLGALALGACSNNSSPPPASTTTTSTSTTSSSSSSAAACSKSLITAAAESSSSSVGSVSAVNGFGCSGSWAYADVTVGSGAGSIDAVIVLQAQGSTWSVADRANACNNHLVPSAIYTQACTTS